MRLLNTIHHLDLLFFDWCLKRKRLRLLISISRQISRSADGYIYFLAAFFFMINNNWLAIKVMFFAFGTERIAYYALKNLLKRNRPPQIIDGFTSVIEPSDQFSFPSGHTSAAFLMLGIMSFFVPWLTIPFLFWALLVGFSRVILGVHFPTDCFAGAIMGYLLSQAWLDLLI